MKLTIGKKLAIGFAIVLVLMTISAVLSYSKSSQIREIAGEIHLVRQIAKITQEAAAGAGESAKAIHELCNLGHRSPDFSEQVQTPRRQHGKYLHGLTKS